MQRLIKLPLFLLLMGMASLAMLAPAVLALSQDEFHDARSFFYSGLIGLILTSFIAIAVSGRPHNQSALRQLIALLAGFSVLPVLLAVPFYEAVRTTTFVNAYFEMVSSMTTTGATLFVPERLSDAEHLWRAMVGWMGGLLMWISAAAILAPLALGGFEITASGEPGQVLLSGSARATYADPAGRVIRATSALAPVYLGLTGVLWFCLMLAGEGPFVAICHAMSTMATSGISPVGGLSNAQSGLGGEILIFLFLLFALSRLTFSSDTSGQNRARLRDDAEFRIGVILIVATSVLLFSRHWIGAFELREDENLLMALRALWGTFFTIASFLTTTGFESADWDMARDWSGLATPGLILMGLAMLGGGVATTAGGVKLLRVFALYLNGVREIERLIHPSSLGRSSPLNRRIRREGAFIAWVFFMLFAITIAAVSITLGALGVGFEDALVLTIAALTNTGPLVVLGSDAPLPLAEFGPAVKLVVSLTMVLGRFELLAIIAVFTPEVWRD